jgi:uncharacterized OB-fold protein
MTTFPEPAVNPENAAFFEAAAEGRLLIKVCLACGAAHWYPRAICPFCFSDRTEWREASGRGEIYSFSILRRAPVPYALACVTLAEGVTMLTNIVDCELDELAIGRPVLVVFRETDGAPVPMFTPE